MGGQKTENRSQAPELGREQGLGGDLIFFSGANTRMLKTQLKTQLFCSCV